MIRVYKYGLLRPILNEPLVRDQLRAKHNYRNMLIEIERGRRAALRVVEESHPELTAVMATAKVAALEIEASRQAIRLVRSKSRSRSETSEMTARVKAARVMRRTTSQALFDCRQRVRPEMQATRDIINERAAELVRGARALTDSYWGSYLLAEDEVKATAKQPLYDGTEPNDPRFERWNGEGQIGVQIQKGMTPSDLFSTEDSRLRVSEPNWNDGKHVRTLRTLSIRVGSEGRSPIWASWPIIMHRALPIGARIKRCNVSLRIHGTREIWTTELTVESSDLTEEGGEGGSQSNLGKAGAVGVDIGWRVVTDVDGVDGAGGSKGLRVCAYASEDGKDLGELCLTAREISRLRKADEIRSICDLRFDAARKALKSWLDSMEIPVWLAAATLHMHAWRSPMRLMGVARRWKKERFTGDETSFDALESWRYWHSQHNQWEADQRTKSLRMRKEKYRVFAAELARKYEVLVLEDRGENDRAKTMDLRKFAKRAPTEADAENEMARSNRHLAATSELRTILEQAFVAQGGRVELAPCENTTRTCTVCGVVDGVLDAETQIDVTCSACGAEQDQDVRASDNLCERWRAAENVGGARKAKTAKSEGRWVKARRMQSEKEHRMVGAREVGDSPAE
jgi:hypothetical protein